MSQCPQCGSELVPDANNQGKVLCYTCMKRFDEDKVNEYWARTQPTMQQPTQVMQQPMQQTAAMPNQYGATQQMPMNQNPYGGQTQPIPGQQYPYGAPAPAPKKGMAIASLIIGILALLGSWFPLVNIINIALGVAGLILGIIALKKANQGAAGGKGIAIGGIITSILTIVVSLIVTIATLVLIPQIPELIEDGDYDEIEYVLNSNEIDDDYYNLLDDEDFDIDLNTNTNTSSTPSNTQNVTPTNGSFPVPSVIADAKQKLSWGEMKFKIEGKEFQLGVNTIEQLETTGWILDLAAAGYSNGYIVNPSQELMSINLKNPSYSDMYVSVTVANPTDATLDIKKCPITAIEFRSYGTTNLPKAEVVGTHISFGAKYADALAGCGEPADTYNSTTMKSTDYEDEPYDRIMTVYAGENDIVNGFRLKIFM